ncbi:hypothetical protein VLK31_25625 [Variovorax sp. H27-G14]|uniref:hypothetical protein n=1 Tax=Variovorax sp. H27-G14 TaxID=3111914 RepID=UPI0038FC3FB8
MSEKLHFLPGSFAVERPVRGKWACVKCQTLIQAPVPAAVIDKGIATAGLMAHVVVSKYIDHRPLFCQEAMGQCSTAINRRPPPNAQGRCAHSTDRQHDCLARSSPAGSLCEGPDRANLSASAGSLLPTPRASTTTLSSFQLP